MDDYKIVEAYFETNLGKEVSVPISWKVQNADKDIKVFVSVAGKIAICDSWRFDNVNSVVKIENTISANGFSVYILRAERAVMLTELISGGKISVGSIITQLEKIVRNLEQHEAFENTAVRSLDKINHLPNKATRKGKFLTFDENGNPICEIEATAFSEAKRLTTLAMNASELAQRKAELAQRKAEIAQGKAEDAQQKAESASTQSQQHATSASSSATNALTSATNASNSASLASMSVGSAKTSEANAKNSETQAKLSEGNASNSEKNAQRNADRVADIVDRFVLGKTPISVLRMKLRDSNGVLLETQALGIVKIKNGTPVLSFEIAPDIQDSVWESAIFRTNDGRKARLTVKLVNGICVPSWNIINE